MIRKLQKLEEVASNTNYYQVAISTIVFLNKKMLLGIKKTNKATCWVTPHNSHLNISSIQHTFILAASISKVKTQ